jgi:hypothetical protein
MSDLLSQFGSYSEQIVVGYDELKNEIGMLRSQIKLLQEKLEGKMEDHHEEMKEIIQNIAPRPQQPLE